MDPGYDTRSLDFAPSAENEDLGPMAVQLQALGQLTGGDAHRREVQMQRNLYTMMMQRTYDACMVFGSVMGEVMPGMLAVEAGVGGVGLAADGGSAVALDTNALIAGVERGVNVLGGRTPVVPITAAKEFLRGGSADALRVFLSANGGRLAGAGSEATVRALQAEAGSMGRVINLGDARIVAGAMREGVPLVTQDAQLTRFLQAAGIAVEGF
jgi:predicted nucleic acid-binding protein